MPKPTAEGIRRYLAELNQEVELLPGYEEAFLGICGRGGPTGSPMVACYGYDRCIDALARRTGMNADQAVEHFTCHILVGDKTERSPLILVSYTE